MSSEPPTAHPALAHRFALGVLAIGAIAVVLTVVPFKQFDLDRHLSPKELALEIVAAAAGLARVARQLRTRAAAGLTLIDCALAGFLALGLVSMLFSQNWWAAARSLSMSAASVAVFWSARAVGASGLKRGLLMGLGVGVVIGASTALLQAYGLVSPAIAEFASLARAPGGSFGNRNFMAHLSAIGVPILLALAMTARRTIGVALPTLGMALLGAAIFLSRTRAAWLALAVGGGLLVPLWLAYRPWRTWPTDGLTRRLVIPLGAALLGAALAYVLPNQLNWKSDAPYLESAKSIVDASSGSGHGRVLQYRNTARMSAAHPLLGVGPGNWAVEYPRYAPRADPSLSKDDGRTSNPWPSSDWMALLSERGVSGFAMLGIALAGLALTALVRMRRAQRSDEFVYALTMFAVLVIAAIEGAFDAVLLLAIPALYVWSVLGALSAPADGRRLVRWSGTAWRPILGVAALVAVLVLARSGSAVAAMAVYSHARGSGGFEQAARLDPGNYRIRMRLATAYAERGRCRQVRAHAGAAHDLFPSAPEPRRLLRACGAAVK
jgi:O-antigen ligase